MKQLNISNRVFKICLQLFLLVVVSNALFSDYLILDSGDLIELSETEESESETEKDIEETNKEIEIDHWYSHFAPSILFDFDKMMRSREDNYDLREYHFDIQTPPPDLA